MEERVVTATGCAAEGFIGALGREFEGSEANSTTDLELPIIKVEPCLFCGRTPAQSIANTSTREKPGLRGGRKLIPKLLRVNLVNGVSEPVLKGADLTKQGCTEGKLVSRIARGADGAKRRDKDVESGEVIE